MKKTNLNNTKDIFVRNNKNWLWLKIGALSLLIMVFGFALSSLANKNSTNNTVMYTCNLDVVSDQISFIAQGVNTVNSSQNRPSNDLIDAIWDLSFSINNDGYCTNIIDKTELIGLKSAFNFDDIGLEEKIDLINAKLSILNKDGVSEPIKLIDFVETISEKDVNKCSIRDQKLFDVLAEEIGKVSNNEINSKIILFLKQLSDELETSLVVPDNLTSSSLEELLYNMALESNCEFELEKMVLDESSDKGRNQKEYLCSSGEIVQDKLLCPLN